MGIIYKRKTGCSYGGFTAVCAACAVLIPGISSLSYAQNQGHMNGLVQYHSMRCTSVREVSQVTGRQYVQGADARAIPSRIDLSELATQPSSVENLASFLKAYTRGAVVMASAAKHPAAGAVEVTADELNGMVDSRVADPDSRRAIKALINIAKRTAKFMINPSDTGGILVSVSYATEALGLVSNNQLVTLLAGAGANGLALSFNPRDPSAWASVANNMVDAMALGGRMGREAVNEQLVRDFLSQPYLSLVREGAGSASWSTGVLSAARTDTATFRLLIPGQDRRNSGGPCIPIVDTYLNIARTYDGRSVRSVAITSTREKVLRPYRTRVTVRTEPFTQGTVRGLALNFDFKIQFYTASQTPSAADKVILGVDGSIYYKTNNGLYRARSGADVSHATYVRLQMDTFAMSQSANIMAYQNVSGQHALGLIPGYNAFGLNPMGLGTPMLGLGAMTGPYSGLNGSQVNTIPAVQHNNALVEPVADPRLSDPAWRNTPAGRRALRQYQQASEAYERRWLRTQQGREYMMRLRAANPAEFNRLKARYNLPY